MGKACNIGVGCNETGICYAIAHGKPEMCPEIDKFGDLIICQFCKGAGVIYCHEEEEGEECSTCSGLGFLSDNAPDTGATAMTDMTQLIERLREPLASEQTMR